MPRSYYLRALLASSVAILPWPAMAQSTDSQDAGEIVVTARGRAEALQTVPLAISAVTGEQLKSAGTTNLRDVSFLTPGLVITPLSGEAGSSPTIRGLVSLGGTTEPTVATFFDGAYIGSSAANSVAQLDLDRIEVVKGPVNGLYGRAAYAGAINYVSRVPDGTFNGNLSATVGDQGQRRLNGALGLPVVTDILSVRIAAGYEGYAGGYTDQVNNLKAGGFEKRDAQISAKFTPFDNFTMLSRVYYGNDSFDNGALGRADANCGGTASYAGQTYRTLYCGEYDEKQHPVEVAPEAKRFSANSRKIWNAYLRSTYEAEYFNVSSLTTYTKVTSQRFDDFNGFRNGIPFNLTPGPGVINLYMNFGSNADVKDFSQELRVSSKQDTSLRWNFGGYYAKSKYYDTTLTAIDSTKLPAGQTITGAPATVAYNFDRYFLSPGGVSSPAVTAAASQTTLWSGFAAADYDITDKLTLTGEIRRTSDERYQDNISSNLFTNAGVYRPLGPPKKATFKYWNERVSAKYQFTAQNMLYATFANGLKAGGFNQRATIASEIAYNPEKNKTYEVGAKTSWLDNRLRINLAAFLVKTKGLQISGPSDDPTNGGFVTKNFGGATAKGLELEIQTRPATGFTLGGGLSYTISKIDDGTYDFSLPASCLLVGSAYCDPTRIETVSTPQGNKTALNLGGLYVPRTPKWTGTLEGGYKGAVTETVDWFVRAQYRYESRKYPEVNNFWWYAPLNRVNLRAGVETGPIRVTGYVENLTKNSTPDSAYRSTLLNTFANAYDAAMPMPRRYGLTVDYKF